MAVDNLFLFATALVFAIIAFLVCVTLTPRKRLAVAAFLAIPQFFIPGLPVSVADVWILFMALTAIPDNKVRVSRPAFIVPLCSLLLAYVLAQFWSQVPFSQPNLLLIARLLFFGVLAWYALSVAADNPKALIRTFKWAVPWILAQSLLTIAFKLLPALEDQFLRSALGSVFVGPSAAGLFNGAANNVLDPFKAGGLFVNANVASMFLGVVFFLCFVVLRAGGSRWYSVVALTSWVAVWATGSKTGAALAVILPVAAFLVPRMSSGLSRLALIPVVLLLIPVAVGLPDIITSIAPDYADNSVSSYGSRSVLWEAAAVLFVGSPWLGLGFGGWAINVQSLLGFSSLPPHNLIIAAWADAGMLAAVGVVSFMVLVASDFIRRIFTAPEIKARKILTYSFCGLLWIFIHGMGDNTTIYGEAHTAFFGAFALASVYVVRKGDHSVLDTPALAKARLLTAAER